MRRPPLHHDRHSHVGPKKPVQPLWRNGPLPNQTQHTTDAIICPGFGPLIYLFLADAPVGFTAVNEQVRLLLPAREQIPKFIQDVLGTRVHGLLPICKLCFDLSQLCLMALDQESYLGLFGTPDGTED